ncbi:MAG: serpin family protein [Bacteroidia bacterium]
MKKNFLMFFCFVRTSYMMSLPMVIMLFAGTRHVVSAQSITTTVNGNNEFAFKLFAEINNGSHNLFYSPFSISSALAMTYAGAREETEMQMSKVLCFGKQQDSLNTNFEKIINGIESDTASGLRLNIANSLWVQKKYQFLDSYFDIVKTNYLSELNNVDFATETEKTRNEINGWVEQKTNYKIKDLLPEKSISSNTELVLVNALYFKGEWTYKFSEKATRKDIFHLNENDTVSADFMNIMEYYNYYQDEKFQVVELPYKGNKVSMIVFLPVKKDNMKSADKEFDYKYYTSAIKSLKPEKVRLSLPKFNTTESFDLGDTLKKMGMPMAFSPLADFSGMTGKKGLFISKILHKSFIDVNEEGTEAAAATAVVMKMTATRPSPFKVFKADHPFMFILRDNTTGGILFMGEIINPVM